MSAAFLRPYSKASHYEWLLFWDRILGYVIMNGRIFATVCLGYSRAMNVAAQWLHMHQNSLQRIFVQTRKSVASRLGYQCGGPGAAYASKQLATDLCSNADIPRARETTAGASLKCSHLSSGIGRVQRRLCVRRAWGSTVATFLRGCPQYPWREHQGSIFTRVPKVSP